MYVVREIMNCKPGKVRPLVEKFKTMNTIGTKYKMPRCDHDDFCAEQHWTGGGDGGRRLASSSG